MIPTPAKRRHQQQEFARKMGNNDDDDDEESDRALLFNGFSLNRNKADLLPEDDDDEVTGELDEEELDEDEDEFDCMRLDTIVEEDEGSSSVAMVDNINCDNVAAVSQFIKRNSANDDNQQAEQMSHNRPQAEQASSMRKFSNFQQSKQQDQLEATKDLNEKSEVAQKMKANSEASTKQHLPSTNRLISEHQARQQQALFRALAERQKLMDELDGSGQRVDLMSAASLAGSLKGRPKRPKAVEHSLKRSARPSEEEGVPLSAVDLSSMSDRMLDELMGQIASASSSSLSSNGESLDSSDLSSNYSESDSEQSNNVRSAGLESSSDTPNVVGVHEDERQRVSLPRKPNCKSAHQQVCDSGGRHRDDDGDDDDHTNDQELLKSPPPDSLSPLPPASRQLPAEEPTKQPISSKLEQYFTSNLVSPHEVSSSETSRTELSVEEVLQQMLEALQEIGGCGNEEPKQQEQLNELLERGFAHLEQLLNCSLTTTSGQQQQRQQQDANRSQPENLAQKMISNAATLSKDSDYGSDTQSADCFSHCTDPNSDTNNKCPESPKVERSSAAPSPAASGALSPLAIELSFKLAESLHKLAQQQQQARNKWRDEDVPSREMQFECADKQTLEEEEEEEDCKQVAPVKRSPMKSIVMINGARPNSANSIVSSSSSSIDLTAASLQSRRNATPIESVESSSSSSTTSRSTNSTKFKTRVNLGTGEVSSVIVEQCNSKISAQETTGSRLKEDIGQRALERRRSTRSSLRRKASFSGTASGLARPGSPLPRSLIADEGGVAVATTAAEQRELSPTKKKNMVKHEEQKEKQLQRALILAQKYNYSPAKLAASKLSAKLQLKEALTDSASTNAINGAQTSQVSELKPLQQSQVKVTGQVQLDISYFAKSGSLTVHVLQCNQLAPVSKRRTTSNPYIKLYLLPDKSKSGKRKSAVHRSELNPKFDEKFTFGPLQLSQFEDKVLWLSVWHKDRLGRNEFLGEILLPLSKVRSQLLSSDLCQSISTKWYQLRDRFDGWSEQQQGRQLTRSQHNASIDRGSEQRAPEMAPASKLQELHMKAARLTTTVAPAGDAQTSLQTMNVYLGPIGSISANQAPITGQLFVALKFVPDNQDAISTKRIKSSKLEGELHVIVKEAHNIAGFEGSPLATSLALSEQQVGDSATISNKPPPLGPLPNPFCKCYLLASNGQRVAKQKTAHVKRSVNPRWDHKCVFQGVKLQKLACQAIEIQMFNRDSILVSNNEYLGGIRLCSSQSSPDSQDINTSELISDQLADRRASLDSQSELCSEREARLWSQMLTRPNIWVYGELRLRHLRPLIAASTTSKM